MNQAKMAETKNYRTLVLWLLTLAYVFSFIDRQILGALSPSIKADLGFESIQAVTRIDGIPSQLIKWGTLGIDPGHCGNRGKVAGLAELRADGGCVLGHGEEPDASVSMRVLPAKHRLSRRLARVS